MQAELPALAAVRPQLSPASLRALIELAVRIEDDAERRQRLLITIKGLRGREFVETK